MKKNVKKLVAVVLSVAMFGSVLTGCGAGNSGSSESGTSEAAKETGKAASSVITVVSREDGS